MPPSSIVRRGKLSRPPTAMSSTSSSSGTTSYVSSRPLNSRRQPASDIFRRLNSYSKQHGLYHALKAFGQILKSIFILRVIDEPVLRMSIEKVLSAIEHVHAFTRAVSIGNPREFLQAEKEDQEMAEACKRLIKNCIICWNY